MKKIGILVAIETESIFAHYGKLVQLPSHEGVELYLCEKPNCQLYILHCGMGEVAAAAGAQYLISACQVSMVMNFGVVGGLTEDMKKQKICVVERVVHYRYDASEFMDVAVGQVPPYKSIYLYPDAELVQKALAFSSDIRAVTCASGDKFVASKEEKQSIHEKFAADICEMEAAGIYLVCDMNRIPCLFLKAVSDGLADGAKGFYEELQDASLKCLQFMDQIIGKLA